jgi:hypothetical protein
MTEELTEGQKLNKAVYGDKSMDERREEGKKYQGTIAVIIGKREPGFDDGILLIRECKNKKEKNES